MKEATYTGISRLVKEGATLDELEAYIEGRTSGLSEDELSAAWLRDWLALEYPEPASAPDLQPLD